MRRGWRHGALAAVAATTAFAVAGCELLLGLGNESSTSADAAVSPDGTLGDGTSSEAASSSGSSGGTSSGSSSGGSSGGVDGSTNAVGDSGPGDAVGSPTGEAGGDADAGASDGGGTNAADADAGCAPGGSQCLGNVLLTCGSNGQWSAWNCATGACQNGACSGSIAAGQSCNAGGNGLTNCGDGGDNCCTSLEVRGGTFYRTYDPVDGGGVVALAADGGPTGLADPATVTAFRLDRYDVTVGRFRQFVASWDGGTGWTPSEAAGKHAHLNGGMGLDVGGAPNTYEPGWSTNDNFHLTPSPSHLTSCSGYTWTASSGTGDTQPINCVNWYEAYAFCIWDGAFLPSETEWEYAAAGGGLQRQYPWGSTDPGTTSQYAIYGCYYDPTDAGGCPGLVTIAPVGTASLGAGLWGQLDMAGNVQQWTLDWYASYVSPCFDCAAVGAPTLAVKALRGSYVWSPPSQLLPAFRGPASQDPGGRGDGASGAGFRCARTP